MCIGMVPCTRCVGWLVWLPAYRRRFAGCRFLKTIIRVALHVRLADRFHGIRHGTSVGLPQRFLACQLFRAISYDAIHHARKLAGVIDADADAAVDRMGSVSRTPHCRRAKCADSMHARWYLRCCFMWCFRCNMLAIRGLMRCLRWLVTVRFMRCFPLCIAVDFYRYRHCVPSVFYDSH